MNARDRKLEAVTESREQTIDRLKSDIIDRIEEALADIITKAMSTKESQAIGITVQIKQKKGDWQSIVSAKAAVNYGRTTRDAKEVGGQLALMGVIFE